MSNIKDIAKSFAEEYCSDAIYPSHLFKAILHKSVGLVHFIETDLDKDYYYLQEWADIQMQLSPRAARPQRDLDYSKEAITVMEEAEEYKEKFGFAECKPACILASLVTPGVGFTFEQLKTLPLTVSEIQNKIGVSAHATNTSETGSRAGQTSSSKENGLISKYCIDKINEAKSGKLPIVIGFENEISVIFEILGRKTKSNLLITGESGVGKTSLINAFVRQLFDGHVPSFLSNAAAYELDLASIGADASYKGELEDRFKNLLREIKEQPNAILIIESIDKLFDKQNSLYGASSILKQELNKGNLLLLCTSSIDGYTKNIETDKEFVTKLEKITLEEPNADLCLRILKGALGTYSEYHHLNVDEPVMVDAIRLAKRYLTEKALPDSAFDLIDRTMALVKTMNDMSANDIASLQAELTQLTEQIGTKENGQMMTELEWLHYKLVNQISCILMAQLDADIEFSKIATAQERIDYLKKFLTSSLRCVSKNVLNLTVQTYSL